MELFFTEEELFAFLQTTDICKGLIDFAFLKGHYETIILSSGDILRPSKGIYILLHGHLQMFSSSGNPIKELFPKESLGEVDIFTSSFLEIYTQALKKSYLIYISKEVFVSLIEHNPILLQNTCQIILKKLQDTNEEKRRPSQEKNIVILPVSPHINAKKYTKALFTEMQKSTSVIHYPPQKSFDVEKTRKELRSHSSFILLECEAEISPWTQFCLEEADRIWTLTTPSDGPSLSPIEDFLESHKKTILARKELFFIHPSDKISISSHLWLEKRTIFSHFHICLDNHLDIQKIARLASCTATGLVLSSGGAKGIAHIGVIKAFLEEGLVFDFVGGSSLGSLVAALYAIGWREKEFSTKVASLFSDILDYTLPVVSLMKGKKMYYKLLSYFSDLRIEDLKTSYFCVSSNLSEKKEKIHKMGRIREAIRASVAFPGILPPVWDEGNILVDGGLFNILPLDAMQKEYPYIGKIFAVDTSVARSDTFHIPPPSFFQNKEKTPPIMDILLRSADLRSHVKKESLLQTNMADVYLRPPIDNYHLFHFSKYKELMEIGYAYAKEEKGRWKECKN